MTLAVQMAVSGRNPCHMPVDSRATEFTIFVKLNHFPCAI